MTAAELRELMRAAGTSYRSLRATIRRGSDDVERLWLERPGKVRAERELLGSGREPFTCITDGERFWTYTPGYGATVRDQRREGPWRPIFDPVQLLENIELEPLGEATAVGRAGVRARATPRPGASDENGDWDADLCDLGPRADAYEFVVDSERGVILRAAALSDGKAVGLIDVLEIAFDERIPAGTFTYEPAKGEQVRSLDEIRARLVLDHGLTLDEAAGRAGFTLWIPAGLAAGWEVDAMYVGGDDDWPVRESVHLECSSRDDDADLSIQLTRQSPEGQSLAYITSNSSASLRVERDGVSVILSSAALDDAALEALAETLVPVDG